MTRLGLGLIFLTLFLLAAGCAAGVPQEQYAAISADLEKAKWEIAGLTDNLTALRQEQERSAGQYRELQKTWESLSQANAAARADYEKLNQVYASLKADNDRLQSQYNESVQRLKQSALVNPTWPQLKDFIERDDTDRFTYVENSFDCSGFAITLRDRAGRSGFRCAYIELSYTDEAIGHALDAFETTDKGTVYVDDVSGDAIAYVRAGQPYGVIALQAVKPDYIVCSGKPDEFWQELSRQTAANPFSYDYYTLYSQRSQFYSQSVEAYNRAVTQYNAGSGRVTSSQLDKWLENLKSLEQDLGPKIYKPSGTVKTIETYWN